MAKQTNRKPADEPTPAPPADVEPADLGDGDETPPAERPAPPADLDRLKAELRAELLAELRAAGAAPAGPNGYAPPAGYKIVPDVSTQDEKSERELDAVRAEVEKGTQRRTQEEADRRFPEGKHRYKVVLRDGNGHPELVISAANETDARARYLAVCGVRHTEHEVAAERA